MQKNILITGQPKAGKSFLLKKLVAGVPDKVGFVTNEVLRDGRRAGFEVESHTGQKAMLSHVDFKTERKVSKYFVDIEDFESLLSRTGSFGRDDLLYIDEIGEMQLFSEKFRGQVSEFLDSENICLATLSSVYEDDFIRDIKKRQDIVLVEISPENRDEKGRFISLLLNKIEKARKYISEPERFAVDGLAVTLKSEHGVRRLSREGTGWRCDCDFFKQNAICSHSIATGEFIKSR
ncbi:MAG: nucleoside-triphosphatase [Candidatus Paceibacterota bacterium]|jgi:nucleoside-triphosphatase